MYCMCANLMPDGPLSKLKITVVVGTITVSVAIFWVLLGFCVGGFYSAHMNTSLPLLSSFFHQKTQGVL